jgi:hypothetical protein
MVKQAVQIYNNERLHWSLDFNTPQNVHQNYNQQKYKSYAKKISVGMLVSFLKPEGSF